MAIDPVIINVLGEVLWHNTTVDPTIDEVSVQHFESISTILAKNGAELIQSGKTIRILEIAAYAHTTGYRLAHALNADVVLMDISPDTLSLGSRIANEQYLNSDSVMRIAGDFHDIPFPDDQFDIVYIASALHHTWQWETVLQEMFRVLAPEGLLILENEPFHREFCFYKFRSSRLGSLRPFEKLLNDSGLIRTIAEPFPGSRPEQLFGMVENQTISLDSFFKILQEHGKILDLQLVPEHNMGDLEKNLLDIRGQGQEIVNKFITDFLCTSVDFFRTYLTPEDLGLGYSLPTKHEILEMAAKISPRICSITDPLSSLASRVELSKLYGAAAKTVVRKNSRFALYKELSLKYEMGSRNDVLLAYPPHIERVLDGTRDLLPDIQASDDNSLRVFFSEDDWQIARNTKSLASVLMIHGNTRISCARGGAGNGTVLVLLRICAGFSGVPYTISLLTGDVVISTFEVYQVESFILNGLIETNSPLLTLNIKLAKKSTGQPLESFPGLSLIAGRIIEINTKGHNDLPRSPSQVVLPVDAKKHILLDPCQLQTTDPRLTLNLVSNSAEYQNYAAAMGQTYEQRRVVELELLLTERPFFMRGYCCTCEKHNNFHVDYNYGYSINGKQIPNWRESIVCEECHLNNRTRGFVHVFEQLAHSDSSKRIYIAEQLSPLYQHLEKKYPLLVGSEYIGNNNARFVERSGYVVQHQDLTSLTFDDNSFDVILHQDVLEHIPNFIDALREGYRVLKPGGYLFFTAPFVISSAKNIIRSRMSSEGVIEHLLPPEYHGNPLDPDGCLAFYHFGWELLEQMKDIGFKDPSAVFYWSLEYGYLGGDQLLFMARK